MNTRNKKVQKRPFPDPPGGSVWNTGHDPEKEALFMEMTRGLVGQHEDP